MKIALALCLLLLGAATCRPAPAELEDPDLQDNLLAQGECVQTPAQFARAFARRDPRCVSPELYGRVDNGATVAEAMNKTGQDKLAYFWSGNDVLQKYLRLGYPQAIGHSTIGNASGLEESSNGLAFLEQVGYPAAYSNVSKVYVLKVFKRQPWERAALKLATSLPYGAGVPFLSPTWDAVRDYFEYVFAEQGLQISDAAAAVLRTTSFSELSGCPAECAFNARAFPSPNATTPVTTAPPDDAGACPRPTKEQIPTESSALVPDSPLCEPEWRDAWAAANSLFSGWGCTNEGNRDAGTKLANLLKDAADDAAKQARLFRAFLFQYCAGGFNPLFSGDGMTYTGFGGMLSPLGTEFITSPWEADPEVFTRPRAATAIPFCIAGTNGGRPNADGVCELPA